MAHYQADGDFLVATTQGIYQAFDVGDVPNAGPSSWTLLGTNTPAGGFCDVFVSSKDDFGLTVFAQSPAGAGCGKDVTKLLWRIRPIAESTWTQVNGPHSNGGFGLFAVHPDDPQRLYAVWYDGFSAVSDRPRMVSSTDGGAAWTFDPDLDAAFLGDHLRTGSVEFVDRPRIASRGFRPFTGVTYSQPSLLAFHPTDPNVIVAGGHDAGLYISTNGGLDWVPLRTPSVGVVRNALHAYFDLEPGQSPSVYIGTQGFGVRRVNLVVGDLVLNQLREAPIIGTGGVSYFDITVSNPSATNVRADEVTIFQALPPGVRFEPAFSSGGCVLGTDGAVRCRIGVLTAGSNRTMSIGVSAVDDGNQQEDCATHLVNTRAYSNAIDTDPLSNIDANSVLVCR